MMKTMTCTNVDSLKHCFVIYPMVTGDGEILGIRTTKEVANHLLLNNESVIKDGCVYYFAIKHIGLNVYHIKLRPRGKINTFIVDAFEEHLIKEGSDSGYPTSRY